MKVRWPRTLEALGEREFRLLFVSQAVSGIGNGMITVALAFAVLDVTGSVSDLGFVFAAESIPLVVFLLAGGVFADRLPRRAVMVTADVVRLASQGTIAALLITGQAEIWQLVVTEAVYGTATAFYSPASTGLVPIVVSPGRLQEANALRGLALWVGLVAGPALAGLLVTAASPGWAFAAQAAGFGVSAGSLLRLRLPPHVWLPSKRFLHDLHDGWREVVARDWVVAILAFNGIASMAFTALSILGPYVSKRSLGGAGAWALIASALGLGGILGGLVALRLRPRRPLFVATCGWAFAALPAALLALHVQAVGVAAGGLVTGFAVGIFYPLWETTLQRNIPQRALSRVSAYDWLAATALAPVGQILIGPITSWIGITATLWTSSILLLAATAATLTVPGVRRLEGDQARRDAERTMARESPGR